MKLDDIPENSIVLKIDIKEGANLQLSIAHHVETDDFTEEELEFIYDLSTGLSVHLQRMLETVVAMGRMSNIISELSEEGPEIINGVLASSIKIESTSSMIAKSNEH